MQPLRTGLFHLLPGKTPSGKAICLPLLFPAFRSRCVIVFVCVVVFFLYLCGCFFVCVVVLVFLFFVCLFVVVFFVCGSFFCLCFLFVCVVVFCCVCLGVDFVLGDCFGVVLVWGLLFLLC